jgi:hypothetical protein
MRKPWSRHSKSPPGPTPVDALVYQAEQPEPARVLDRPERPMGLVDPEWISPVTEQYLDPWLYPNLTPYFAHVEYVIYVEARPYAGIVAVAPAEEAFYQAGSIWGMCYSRNCVKGEEGHHHLSQLEPISAVEFERARASGWAEL